MSYIFLAEQGEVSSVESFQDIPQFVLSKSKTIQEKFFSKGSEMDLSQNSRSGMILQHLMGDLGKGELISLPGGSHVKTFPQQEKELASMANGQDSGEKWQGWLAKYDQNLSSWKTAQCSLLEDYIEFSETFPAWGTMRDGACWGLMMPEQGTEERGSGYWPTPNTLEAIKPKKIERIMEYNQKARPGRTYAAMNLREQVVYGKQKIWPTPRAGNPGSRKPGTGGKVLGEEVKNWPTPSVCGNYNRKGCSKTSGDGLATQVKNWPTPSANEDAAGTPDGKMQWMLTQAAKSGCGTRTEYEKKKLFPTPGTTGFSNGTGNCEKANTLHKDGILSEAERVSFRAGNGGQLNPDWVEWLMGWPIGWSSLDQLGNIDFPTWQSDPADTGDVPRVGKNIPNRAKRLKAIGNGQVPQVVAIAFSILSEGI